MNVNGFKLPVKLLRQLNALRGMMKKIGMRGEKWRKDILSLSLLTYKK